MLELLRKRYSIEINGGVTFVDSEINYFNGDTNGGKITRASISVAALERTRQSCYVSSAELHFSNRGMDMFTMWDLETLPGYLRQGYASAVVRGCVELVRQAGSNASLVTYVDVVQPEGELGRRELLSMYERLGFKRIDTVDIGPNKRVKRRVHMLAHTEFGEY